MVLPARLGASTVIGSEELDALSLGLAVVDAQWGIVRWTRALAELTGVPTQDALGASLWDRLLAAVAVIEGPLVDVHADEGVGLGTVEAASVLHRVVKRRLAVVQ